MLFEIFYMKDLPFINTGFPSRRFSFINLGVNDYYIFYK